MRHFVVGLGLVVLIGCGKPAARLADDIAAAPPIVGTGEPVTEEEAREFAMRLQEAIESGDVERAESLLRILELFERSISDLLTDTKLRSKLMSGIPVGRTPLIDEMIAGVDQGGSYRFLHLKTIDQRPCPIFRFVHPEEGFNYHVFKLVRFPGNRIGVEDIDILLIGEPLTQMLRRFMMPVILEQNRSLMDRLRGKEQMFLKHFPTINSIIQSAKSGEGSTTALLQFRSLPPELQKMKTLQLLAIKVAARVGNDDYLKELERFREQHRNDPSLDLLLVDFHTLRKEYDQVATTLDRLKHYVGDDPFIDVLRASNLIAEQRYGQAAVHLDAAIDREKTLDTAYHVYVTWAREQKKFDDMTKWYRALVENCNIQLDFKVIEEDNDYQEYVKTEAYRSLKTWYEMRMKNK